MPDHLRPPHRTRLRAIEDAQRLAAAGPPRASLLRVCLWLLAAGALAVVLVYAADHLEN